MRWAWRWWRNGHEERRKRSEAEERLQAARRQTPQVKRAAERTADMPADQFADLVSRAFKPRRSA